MDGFIGRIGMANTVSVKPILHGFHNSELNHESNEFLNT